MAAATLIVPREQRGFVTGERPTHLLRTRAFRHVKCVRDIDAEIRSGR
jgi:hypothetical protein